MKGEMKVQETERAVQLKAQTHLWNLLYSYFKTAALKAAIDLGIADIIHNHGEPLTASQLAAKIPITSSVDVSCLDRLMRLLILTGVFAEDRRPIGAEDGHEVVYGLTPLSRLLLRDGSHSQLPFALLNIYKTSVDPKEDLAAFFRPREVHPTAQNGELMWVVAGQDPVVNKLFNEAMASDTELVMAAMVEDCGQAFDGVSSLVDVGGGTGCCQAHNPGLPAHQVHGIGSTSCCVCIIIPVTPNVQLIEGDMFESIQQADAVLLKWIMHNWSDEECTRILRRCREAIPKPGGKVIILDIVRKQWADRESNETQLFFDLIMMSYYSGKERDEEEWKKLFLGAGFSGYKIVAGLGLRSLIEVYP